MAKRKNTDNRKNTDGRKQTHKPAIPPRAIADLRPVKKETQKAKIELLTDREINRILDEFEQRVITGSVVEEDIIEDRLWESRRRVPQVLADRLADNRTKIPALAFEMLMGFAGSKTKTYLKAIAESSRADDIVRFGSHRRMGWPERGETKARIAFLNSLRDPLSTLLEATRQSTAFWPPDGEILSEVVGYVKAASSEFRLQFLERAIRDIEPDALVWLLRPLLHIPDHSIQKPALAHLVSIDGQTSIHAIRRLAQTAGDLAVRSEAEAVARRLQFRVVAGRPIAEGTQQELPPVDSALASPIDGAGGQVLFLKRTWAPGLYLIADVLYKDSYGVKDAFGFYRVPEEEADDMVENFSEDRVALVEIDIALARGILAEAVETNAASGHGIPPSFEIWEPLFHDVYPPRATEPVEVPALDDSPFGSRRDLYLRSGELLLHPFFESWFFNPDEIEPVLDRVPTPAKKKGLGDAQLVPMVRLLVDDRGRHTFRRRLQRQAKLLDQVGDANERDLCLAAAAWLSDDKVDQLGKHPLLQGMVLRSIANLYTLAFV